MILSLVWVYFRYIFIYFHTRINESSLFEFEQNFPSIKRYLSFVNWSTKTCVYFHPSFSHIINHRIFVDRFCSRITFPKKKNPLDLVPRSDYIDRRRSNISNRCVHSTEWSRVIVAQFRTCAHAEKEREEENLAKRNGWRKERERETVSISIFWKTGLACLHESNFHATDLTVCVCPIMFANYLSRD